MLADIVLFLVLIVIIALIATVIMHALLPVPYVPTLYWIGLAMVEAAHIKEREIVYDLGAGDGRLLALAQRMHPTIRAIGYEIVPTVWLFGIIRLWCMRSKVELKLCNVFSQNLQEADIVFLYTSTMFLKRLMPKLEAELSPGTRVISRAFALPNRVPTKQLTIVSGWRRATLFVYQW